MGINAATRMHMHRFTRLINAFSKKSKKLENHMHAISLYFMFYNFCKIHKSLRVTPAMEAGLTDHIWSMAEVVGIISEEEQRNADLTGRELLGRLNEQNY